MAKINIEELFYDTERCLDLGAFGRAEKNLKKILSAHVHLDRAEALVIRLAEKRGYIDSSHTVVNGSLACQRSSVFVVKIIGIHLRKQGNIIEAIRAFELALQIDSKLEGAYVQLAQIYFSLAKLHEAIEVCQRGLRVIRHSYPLIVEYVRSLEEVKDFENALKWSDHLIKLQPENAEGYFRRGNVLYFMGRLSEAVNHYKQSHKLDPNDSATLSNLSTVFINLYELDKGAWAAKKAFQINPSDHVAHSNYLYLLMTRQQTSQDVVQCELDNWYLTHCRKDLPSHVLDSIAKNSIRHIGNKRLKVGYVSSDFRSHVVSRFIEPLLKNHDKARVEIFCYATCSESQYDGVTQKLMGYADHWRAASHFTDLEFSSFIQKDEIDILIDLNGHTPGNRLKVFAFKPAPIQLTYLGFFGSTGVKEIDYWITDACLHPEGCNEARVEKLYRLPRCWVSFQPPDVQLDVARIKRVGNDSIVFGCFSEVAKYSDEMLKSWCEILEAVEKSELMLINKAFESDELKQRIRSVFDLAGIVRDRIIFETHLPYIDYLKAYRKVDVILDTYPRTGGTTTAEALWMGVPVVTLASDTYAGRISASKLCAAGMGHLVAGFEAEYVNIAINLASKIILEEPDRDARRNQFLSSPVCDGQELATVMEDAFTKMYVKYIRDSEL